MAKAEISRALEALGAPVDTITFLQSMQAVAAPAFEVSVSDTAAWKHQDFSKAFPPGSYEAWAVLVRPLGGGPATDMITVNLRAADTTTYGENPAP